MSTPLLLDTNACIFVVEDTLSPAARQLLTEKNGAREKIYVSPFTAWELGSILSKGHLRSSLDADAYFRELMAQPGFELADLTADVLISSWYLPGSPPRDPADRILAATARIFGFALLTSDRGLLRYAREGHLRAIPC